MVKRSVAIIGAGVGGLSAAIHARVRGYDVVVVEQGAVPGGKAAGQQVAGYELDPGPSIIILTRIYDELFALASKKREDYINFDRLSVISRVVMEGHEPLNLPADESECLKLLKGLEPKDADSMEGLLDRIARVEPLLWNSVFRATIDQPWQMLNVDLLKFGQALDATKPFKDCVDNLFRLPMLRAFFYGFPSYGGQTYWSRSPGSFLIPYYMLRDGIWSVRGGVRAIPAALFKLARDLGVEFRFRSKVTGVERNRNRLTGLVLENGERVHADGFVSNQDRFTFGELLGRVTKALPSYSYFTIHWGIRQQFPKLEHHNLLIPKDFEQGFDELYGQNKFPKRPIVYINSTKDRDEAAAPDGCANLFAVVTSPALQSGSFNEEEAYQRVRGTMASLHLHWDSDLVDFERIQSPHTFVKRDSNYGGSLYGVEEKSRLWGMFPASNRDPELGNLTYCGGSVQPGAGLPMVVLSGKFAVGALAKCLG